jgi:multidrug efflux pump subunit AcrA (membrane-fusion protein)
VTITLQGTVKGLLENSQVQVSITSRQHKNVLAVPTTALRAVPGGTYEVVVRSAAGAKHVPVTTGLFDEATGLAELSGEGLAEGQQVEVPSDSP